MEHDGLPLGATPPHPTYRRDMPITWCTKMELCGKHCPQNTQQHSFHQVHVRGASHGALPHFSTNLGLTQAGKNHHGHYR